jgi:Tfp pilus assembly protein PilO
VKLPVDLRALWARILVWYNAYSERDRRIILGILVATGLSLVYIGIVEPILDYRKAVGQQIAEDQEQLERAMRMVGAKDALRAEREDLRKRLTQAKARLLPGGTATLGAAALQERANSLASEKGISVQSTQVMKEEVLEPFRKVAVRLTLSGELKPLAEFVSGIEYGQQLNVPFVEVSRRGAVAGAKGPRTLSVTVEVSGFVQGTAPAKTEGAEGEAVPTIEAQAEGALVGEPGGPAQIGDAPTGDGVPSSRAEGTAEADAPTTLGGTATSSAATSTTLAVAPGTGPADGSATTVVAPTTIISITFPSMTFPTTTPPTAPPAGSPRPGTRGASPPPPPGSPPPPPPPGIDEPDEDGE